MISYLLDGIEYKPFNHLYAVSRCGKFLRKGVPINPKQRPDGYLHIGRQQLAHRLVAAVWCERPDGANHVHHINHIKDDNHADNLQWVTPKQHMGECHADTNGRHTMSESGRQKLRTLRLGSKTSEATKQKQREASLRLGCRPPTPMLGRKLSKETIAKMRENSPNANACKVNGIAYQSFNQAGDALGIKPHTLRKRCISKNFPEYQLET